MLDDQLQTAVNDQGFEVDLVRRVARDGGPHPLAMSQTEGDLWTAQIDTGNWLVSGRRVEQVVVSPRGEMALKRTVHPLDFIAVKRELAEKPSREAEMAPKDRLQADVMQYLLEEALSHLESAQ